MKKTPLLIVILACSQVGFSQQQVSYNDADIEEPIVGITITQKQIGTLRNKILEAQDNIIDLFNELNDDDEFDIICRRAAYTGTRMSKTRCSPNYYGDALANEAQSLVRNLQGTSGLVPFANTIVVKKNKILKSKMIDLVSTNSDFREEVDVLNELVEELIEYRESYYDL